MMEDPREVLLVDTVPTLLVSKLESAGFKCTEAFDSSLEELILQTESGVAGLIIRSRFRLMADEIARMGPVDFIGRVGSGMENIDTAAAEAKGIRCFNAPEGNSNAVAEHAMGLLLGLLHHIPRSDRQVRNGQWIREGNRGHELEGRTVGIIGFGNTGSKFAAKLRGFDCSIIANDPYVEINEQKFPHVTQVGLNELKERSDIISLHVPLNKDTQMMVNDTFISECKDGFRLINTSRGKVVDTPAIVRALKNDLISGVALDVIEYEKHSFEGIRESEMPEDLRYLVSSDRCILTPHIAGWTHESNRKMAEILVEKIISYYDTRK